MVTRVAAVLGRRPLALALLVYAAFDVAYFGLHVLPHLGRMCACSATPDPTTYMWFLAWWPHALLHGANPFDTHLLFAPDRVNLGAVDVVPGQAILSTPATLLFGPVVTYNLWAFAGPLLAAVAAFALCRYVVRNTTAALVGGYIFGFSPYMLGQMIGHLDLATTFPIPISVLLMLRLIDGRIGRRTFVPLMALTLGFQLLIQPELTLTLGLLGACALLVALALAPEARSRIIAAVPPLLAAAALAAAVTSMFIYEALNGQMSSGFFVHYSDTYVADALGFLVPTTVLRFGRSWFHVVAGTFTGNIAEDGVYVGVVLAAVVGRYLITRWANVSARILTVMLALVILLMLGPHLHIGGQPTVPLPWGALRHLPLLDHVAPVRIGVYMYLIVALIVSGWLSRPRPGWRGVAKWGVAAIGILTLVPNIASGVWRAQLDNPSFFTTSAYRSVVAPGSTVLALPFAQDGQSMLWQAEAGFSFKMADGYVGALAPADYARDLGTPPLSAPGVIPSAAVLGRFLEVRDVRTVLVNADEAGFWPRALARLGLRARLLDGVLVYQVPGTAWRSGRAPVLAHRGPQQPRERRPAGRRAEVT